MSDRMPSALCLVLLLVLICAGSPCAARAVPVPRALSLGAIPVDHGHPQQLQSEGHQRARWRVGDVDDTIELQFAWSPAGDWQTTSRTLVIPGTAPVRRTGHRLVALTRGPPLLPVAS